MTCKIKLRRTKDEGRGTSNEEKNTNVSLGRCVSFASHIFYFSSLVLHPSSFIPRPSSFIILLVLFTLFAPLSLTGCGKVKGIPMESPVAEELSQTQKFTLKNLDGTVTDLSQVLSQNKAVLLNFWATWCTYCVEEMPELVRLQNEHKSKGFTVLAVNVGESEKQAAIFAKQMSLNFPVLLDETNEVAQAYGLVGIPVSYLVNSQGKVLGEYHGFTPKMITDVEKALAQS